MKMNRNFWQKLSDNQKRKIKDALKSIITAFAVIIATIFGLNSCQVTRTITTESSSIQKGDTSVIIQTKTIESYNAIKNDKK